MAIASSTPHAPPSDYGVFSPLAIPKTAGLQEARRQQRPQTRRPRSAPAAYVHELRTPTQASLVIFLALSLACSGPESPAASPDHTDRAQGGTAPTSLNEASDSKEGTLANRPLIRHGIDLSSHSGDITWTELTKADFDFVFLKATEGVDLADPSFAKHWTAALEAGLVRGAYHFYVTEDDPIAQANFFISRVTLNSGDLRPVVDIELLGRNTAPDLAAKLRTFLDTLAGHYNVKPIIYTSPNFWDQHLDDSFGDHPLWIAEYGVDEPRLPKGWDDWSLWQWQDDSNVAGVEKDADLNRVHPSVSTSALTIP